MADGFLGRWAKRKAEVREGRAVPDDASTLVPPPPPSPSGGGSEVPPPPLGEGRGGGTPAEVPPSLEEAQALTPTSDFTRFVRPDVAPEVKNAALKKLFTDPHFNRMDGLDVYIDDYSKPDPLPAAMARQLASAKFLQLFEETDEEKKAREEGREVADDPAPPSVAQSGTAAADPAVPPPAATHADPDLRLQQDHAPGPEGPGQGHR